MIQADPGDGKRLQLWGGVECTVNRVGDRYFDQLAWTGHDLRREDLYRFAELEVSALRYPILWERMVPEGGASSDDLDAIDWSWADDRLSLLRALGIRPIVGFVHHGSGPRKTGLLEPSFAVELARFAAAFARRYPWVCDYTPINEPQTAARFSGLYGFWYPHHRGDASFVRALLSQCRAVVLAMRAIRAINPRSRLVQTEDLGQVASTPLLAYQARFENQRRWLSLDLLTGLVNRQHPLWRYLREQGEASEDELLWFSDPCPPDIVGLNYYLTSDRFLDHRRQRHPQHTWGGNGRHRYADVEAVRVRDAGISGHDALLAQTWHRYRLPLAITEVHLGCTREEQLRWLAEAWDAATEARKSGVSVEAVTAWALLGSKNWHTLVTRDDGTYESGVFDVRGGTPRRTALAQQVAALSAGQAFQHPVLSIPGWWRRDQRWTCQSDDRIFKSDAPTEPAPAGGPQPILITGGNGTLGTAFGRACRSRGIRFRLLSRSQLDIADMAAVRSALATYTPWAVINAAGYVRIDDAEHERETCHRDNTMGPEVLATACREQGVQFLTFSSAMVFDGLRGHPYVESDEVAPLSVYGNSKAEAERRVLLRCPDSLIARTSAFFGPWDARNFVTVALRTLVSGQRLRAAADVMVSPTYVPDLVSACLDLLIDREAGVWHLTNDGAITWAQLAVRAAELAGYDTRLVEECEAAALGYRAARPKYTVLCSERGILLPALSESLGRYLRDSAPMWLQAA